MIEMCHYVGKFSAKAERDCFDELYEACNSVWMSCMRPAILF